MKRNCNNCIGSFLSFLILIISSSINISASNWITVATIGNVPSLNTNQDPQRLVDQVIAFWKSELDQVLPDKPDLIVLPEYCDLSDAGDTYLAVRRNQVLDFFSEVALANKCYISFGMKREESKGIWRNSCVLIDRNGNIAGIYNKFFPTIPEMEGGIKAGKEAPVFKCDFGKVAIAICFDLNFDELRLQYAEQQPDIILFSSMYHGGIVQSQWAYSCRSFFIASVYRSTPSEIRNPLGEIIASNTNYIDYAITRINLDYEPVHLDFNRDKLTSLKKRYGERVDIHDPGKLGVVLVTSNDDKVSVDQMIDEFKIERLDQYFSRSREFRLKNGNNR